MWRTVLDTLAFTALMLLLLALYGIFGDDPTPLFHTLPSQETR